MCSSHTLIVSSKYYSQIESSVIIRVSKNKNSEYFLATGTNYDCEKHAFLSCQCFCNNFIRSCLLFSFQTLSYQSFKINTTTTRYKVTVKETTHNRMQQKINTLSKANYKRYKHVFEDIHFFFFTYMLQYYLYFFY